MYSPFGLDLFEFCYHLANSNSSHSLEKKKPPHERFKKRDRAVQFYAETRKTKPDFHAALK